MPSFRLELEIGRLRPGHDPNEVMDTAQDALGDFHVDATDIAVTAGTPRILLRFSVPDSSVAEENQVARLAAVHTRDAVDVVASTGQLWVLRRTGGRWRPLG